MANLNLVHNGKFYFNTSDSVDSHELKVLLKYGVALDGVSLNGNDIKFDSSLIDTPCSPSVLNYIPDSLGNLELFEIAISNHCAITLGHTVVNDRWEVQPAHLIGDLNTEFDFDISEYKEGAIQASKSYKETLDTDIEDEIDYDDEYSDENALSDDDDDYEDYDINDEDDSVEGTDDNLYEKCKLVSEGVLKIVESDNPHSSAMAEYSNDALTNAEAGLCFFFDLHTDIDDERDRLDIQIRSLGEEELAHSYLYDDDIIDVDKVYETAKSLLDSFLDEGDDLVDWDSVDDFGSDEDTEDEDDIDYSDYDTEDADEAFKDDWEKAIPDLTKLQEDVYVLEVGAYGDEKLVSLPPFNNGDFTNKDMMYWGSLLSDEDDEEDVEDSDEDDDSTESKLFARLTEEQAKLIQMYYLYTSEYVFKLNRGNTDLKPQTKADMEALRGNTTDTWNYLGFIDMGFKGAAVCPTCGARQRFNAVSKCCGYPIVRDNMMLRDRNGKRIPVLDENGNQKMIPKIDKKTKKPVVVNGSTVYVKQWMKGMARSYSGQCIKCMQYCDVMVSDTIAGRKMNRSKKVDVVCANCGTVLKENSHYTARHKPTRYMHIAWNTSKADANEAFYGQLTNNRIEDVIESEACVKLGIDDIASFFDIDKKSDAYKTLKEIGTNCRKDILELENLYTHRDEFNEKYEESFKLLDSFVPRLVRLAGKEALLKRDPILPVKLLQLYTEMRKQDMLIPRSLIQFIRDFIVDWDTHKFISMPDKDGYNGTVGTMYGATKAEQVFEREGRLLIGLWGNKAENLYKLANPILKVENIHTEYKNSAGRFFYNYLTDLFIYQICGFYKYNAGNSTGYNKENLEFDVTDEGGRGDKHRKELGHFMSYKSMHFKDFEISYDYVTKLIALADIIVAIFEKVSTLPYVNQRKVWNERRYRYVIKNDEFINKFFQAPSVVRDTKYEDSPKRFSYYVYTLDKENLEYDREVVSKYDENLADNLKIVYDMAFLKYKSDYTLDEYIEKLSNAWNYVLPHIEGFKTWLETSLQSEYEAKNKASRDEAFNKATEEFREEQERKAREEAERKAREEAEAKEKEEREKAEAEAQAIKDEAEKQAKAVKLAQMQDVLSGKVEAKTKEEVIAYLSSNDLSGVDATTFGFHLKLANQFKNSKYEPSDKQFYYLKTLYEKVSGKTYGGTTNAPDKKSLDDDKETKAKLEYIVAHKELVKDEKTYAIVQSVLRYGSISERQQKYVDDAVRIYEENVNE